MLPDLSKLSQEQRFIYNKTMQDYIRVSDAVKDPNCKDKDLLILHQIKLCRDLQTLHLTPEDKVQMYLDGRVDELPPDGAGKDEICGKLLPTEEEVSIGMYPARELYYYNPYTCGVYMFYSLDGRYKYIGGSQYIEYALHSHFCRWRSERNPDKQRKSKFRGLKSLRYMLDNYPGEIRFKILERVPYSLLDTAIRYQRTKHKCLYQYDIKSTNPWTAANFEAGKYNY